MRDGDLGSFQQVVLVDREGGGGSHHALSMGHTEVKKILGWDQENEIV